MFAFIFVVLVLQMIFYFFFIKILKIFNAENNNFEVFSLHIFIQLLHKKTIMINDKPIIHIKMIIFTIYVFTLYIILNKSINKYNKYYCYYLFIIVKLLVCRISITISNLVKDKMIFLYVKNIDFLRDFHFRHLPLLLSF